MKKTTVKKTVTAAPVTEKVQAAEQSLDLQHTPALLELAQQNDKKDDELTSETNKMEESENQMVEGLDDDNENEDKNFIQVSSSEEGLKADDGDIELVADDEDASLADTVESESDPKENGADNVAAESEVVETVTKAAKKPAKKNKDKEEEGGLIEGIVSALIDDTDDDKEEATKTEVSLQE